MEKVLYKISYFKNYHQKRKVFKMVFTVASAGQCLVRLSIVFSYLREDNSIVLWPTVSLITAGDPISIYSVNKPSMQENGLTTSTYAQT